MSCSILNDSDKRIDRLMIYHRFKEARELLNSSSDAPQAVCTGQVLSRCIDLRNYRPPEPWKLLTDAQLSRSFILALSGDSVTTEPEAVKSEANAILDIILPFALDSKEVMTRALNTATFHSDYELMNRLIAFGWDKFGTDDEGLTPLMKAVRHHRRGSFHLLIDKGADIHLVNKAGENLVHFCARTVHSDHIINVMVHDLILNNKLDWNTKNSNGLTPLKIAETSGNYDFLDLLK